METTRKDKNPVVWTATFEESKRRWKISFVLVNFIYLTLLASMGLSFLRDEKAKESLFLQQHEFDTFKAKETIYTALRNRGVSLSQGLDIAEVTIRQSKKLNLSMSLILAVMKKESEFTPYALSSANAMGLMQVHPITWNEYAAKLKLNVFVYAAFDPVTNVVVATNIIKDLYDHYRKTARSESDLWESVLSAYYAGRTSIAQNGIYSSHRKYVADVNRFKSEFEKKLAE